MNANPLVLLLAIVSTSAWAQQRTPRPEYRGVLTVSNFKAWNAGAPIFHPGAELGWKFPLKLENCDDLVCQIGEDAFVSTQARLRSDFQGVDVDYTVIFKPDPDSGFGRRGGQLGGSFSVGFENSDQHRMVYTDAATIANSVINVFVPLILGGVFLPERPAPVIPNIIRYKEASLQFEWLVSSMRVLGSETTPGIGVGLGLERAIIGDDVFARIDYRYLRDNDGNEGRISTTLLRPQLEVQLLDGKAGVVVGTEYMKSALSVPENEDLSDSKWRLQTGFRLRVGRH